MIKQRSIIVCFDIPNIKGLDLMILKLSNEDLTLNYSLVTFTAPVIGK